MILLRGTITHKCVVVCHHLIESGVADTNKSPWKYLKGVVAGPISEATKRIAFLFLNCVVG